MSSRVLIPFRHAKKVKSYVDALEMAGAEAVTAHVDEPIRLTGMAGLLLMGGTDVDPARYGSNAIPETDEPDYARDRAELDLIEEAVSREMPILAICRGLQILNVYHGGTLIQHLGSTRHAVDTEDKGAIAHEVSIEPESLLGRLAGTTRWSVNSRHHQAADKIGAGLTVVARDAEDGTVEGLERPDRPFVLAVQWHPEDQVAGSMEQRKLFRRFVEALS